MTLCVHTKALKALNTPIRCSSLSAAFSGQINHDSIWLLDGLIFRLTSLRDIQTQNTHTYSRSNAIKLIRCSHLLIRVALLLGIFRSPSCFNISVICSAVISHFSHCCCILHSHHNTSASILYLHIALHLVRHSLR